MSFYATITGQIKYANQQHFNAVVADLIQCGWADHSGYFLDELNHRISEEPNIDFGERVINLPLYTYRNLSRFEFFKTGCTGYTIGTSTDGCFEGWVITSNDKDFPTEISFDLTEWAKEQELEEAPDPNEDFENYCLWMADVEESFHQTQLVHVQTLLNLGDNNG